MANKAIKAVVAAAAAYTGVSAALGAFAYTQVIERNATLFKKVADKVSADNNQKREVPFASKAAESEKWLQQQTLEEYAMVNDRGQMLKGWLLPAENSKVFVFCSHGYRSSGRGEYGKFTKFYHENGINVFMVDHQAHGESEGDKIGFGYYEYQDCLKWLGFINERFGSDIQIFLHGISMGCATVMLMTGDARLPSNVKFTIADCGYTSAWNQFTHNLSSWHVPVQPTLFFADVACRIKAGYTFRDADPINKMKLASIPVLFIHGSADGFVPTRMGPENYAACGSKEKKLIIVDGADHAESYKVNPDLYEENVKEYIAKYIK